MPTRELDGFEMWSAARQHGDSLFYAEIETKALDGSGDAHTFRVKTDRKLRSLEEAHRLAADAITAITSIDEKGVPSPLRYPIADQASR